MKIFSIRERHKSRHKFRVNKVCKTEELRKYFVNLEIEIEVFSYIICSLDFKHISCILFLLHMKTMNGVVSWYILAPHHLFHSIAYVSFLSIFFLVFFWVLLLAEVFTWVWGYLKKAVEFSLSHLLKISLKENLICFKILGIWSNILYLFVIYFFANPFLLSTQKTWGIHRAWKSCFLLPTYKPAT